MAREHYVLVSLFPCYPVIMRLMNIASSSSGNATYVGTENTHLLIDCGISRRSIIQGLNRISLKPCDLDALLITHEHSDHTISIAAVQRCADVAVYLTEGTKDALDKAGRILYDRGKVHVISADSQFRIGDITVTALRTSHDAREPVCYRFSDTKSSCAIVTDLGEYDSYLTDALSGLDAVIMEANHDSRMLETGPYPYPLKLRIAGEKGHLSNEASGRFLSQIINEHLKYIVLAHLSKTNNYAELARLAVRQELDGYTCFESSDLRIDIADPSEGTAVYDF